MERKTQLLISFGVIIVLITGLYFFTDWFSRVTGYFTGEDEKTKLAQCLDGKGTEFYTSDFCAECQEQEELFEKSFKFIYSIDCGKEKELCPNIKSIPAWYINKTFHYGFKNMTELQEISGCVDE